MGKPKSNVDKIKDILNDKYVAENQKQISEKNIMHRKIVKEHVKYILYQFDTSSDIFPFFNSKSGLKRICDYCIFAEDNKKGFFVFLVELKKRTKSPIPQLEASECFIKFILESAERIGMKFDNPYIRKVGITDAKFSDKRETAFYKHQSEFDKHRYLQIKNDLRLSHLISFHVNPNIDYNL